MQDDPLPWHVVEPTQTLLEHWSFVVAALPSLHGVPLALFTYEHVAVAGSQPPPSWHWLGAGQVSGVPLTQFPA